MRRLLERLERVRSGVTGATLSGASRVRRQAGEIDQSYAAYDEHPLGEPDEWGDLASFRRAAACS